ncbi:MAG: hypothetical protein A2133_05255 [Actinobacteria bacterium RBG_16_64_13]|nr:MAG: hypothetical protein A2133_05255 [Actinobacteria bacterium RBG_16_64_13]
MLVALWAVFVCALFTLLAPSADAFTVQGGSAAQQDLVTRVIQACALPYGLTDAELRAAGPVDIKFVTMPGVSAYSKIGTIYINIDCAPGETLTELAAHEWAHQIWYSLGPKWWEKWAALSDPTGKANDSVWRLSIPEDFAECARMALWSGQDFLRDYACTDLKVIAPGAVRDWVTLARYVNKCPFFDLGPTAMPSTAEQDELAAAAAYVYTTGVMTGYSETIFRADALLSKHQLATICQRAGLDCPEQWSSDAGPATRGEVHDTVPGLTWTASRWSDPITRGQLARLIWRTRTSP